MSGGTGAAVRRLAALAFRSRPGLALVCLALVAASAAANLALVWSVRRLVDTEAAALGSVPAALARAGVAFAAMLLLAAADSGVAYAGLSLAESLAAELRSRMLASFLAADYRSMIRHHRGEVSTWLVSDLDQVKGGLVRLFTSAVRDPIVLVLLASSMFALDPPLASLAVAVTAALVLPLLLVGRRTRRLSRGMLDELGRVISYHTDTLGALRAVKSYVAEKGVAEAYARRNEGLRRSFVAVVRWGSLSGPIVTLGTGVLLLAVVAVGLQRVSSGRLSTGTLVALVSSLLLFARPAAALAGTWNGLQAALAGAAKVFAVLDLAHEKKGGAKGVRFRERLSFERVSFGYDDERLVLSDVSLELPYGGSLAIVGPNGSGKSTLVGLLVGLLRPTCGLVRLDGRPVSELDVSEYRRLFALVSAEPELFADTVHANVALWDPSISAEDVRAALGAVGMAEWLAGLPAGTDTLMGPGRLELSRGQRQKLSLARALVRRAQVLVLDEATESLDPRTVSLLDGAARDWLGAFTVVLITHRVTLLERFDTVAVMQEGRVLESGSHRELLAAGGLYRELVELRRRHEQEARLV